MPILQNANDISHSRRLKNVQTKNFVSSLILNLFAPNKFNKFDDRLEKGGRAVRVVVETGLRCCLRCCRHCTRPFLGPREKKK